MAASPDSVIFTLDSNFSLFSSASASVDRCSFASDAHDHDSASEFSLHLAGLREGECSSGPDPDPNPNKAALHKHSRFSRKGDKVIVVSTEDSEEGEVEGLDSARSSFSLAIKECQERKSRSNALSKKSDRRRPASLDFSSAAGGVKRSSMARKTNGAFPSPGTPNYLYGVAGLQKGWSSERVPLQSAAGRRNSGAAFLPFSNNGRTLPSKWEDAERWILSPVSGDGAPRPSIPPPERRPKSKSGPLGTPGVAYYSLYSPALPMFEGGNMGQFMAGSPFSAGVIGADRLSLRNFGYHGVALSARPEPPSIGRSASVHGCSEHLNQPPTNVLHQELPGEKLDGVKDATTDISRDVSRRDMATQMSPEASDCSSLSGSLSFTRTLPDLSTMDLPTINSSRMGVKDVEVDEQFTLTGSKRNKYRIHGKGSRGSRD